jgi:putative ABC transport system substrate-binding protein
MQTVATRFGLQLQSLDVRTPADFDGAFEAAVRGRAQALIALPSPLFIAHYKRILDFATKSSLPAMYPFRDFVRAGGLMSYAPSDQNWRRAASYVDKILKGAKPADLPVEQPTKFELMINMRTAKALGLMIPTSLLLRAEEIIE